MTRKLTPDPSYSIGGVKMADQGAADPGNNNNNKPETSEGTIIKVTVKTPKDKEEIAIAEDASVNQVGWFRRCEAGRCGSAPCSNVMPLPTTSARKLVSSVSLSIATSLLPANWVWVEWKWLCVLKAPLATSSKLRHYHRCQRPLSRYVSVCIWSS